MRYYYRVKLVNEDNYSFTGEIRLFVQVLRGPSLIFLFFLFSVFVCNGLHLTFNLLT